MESSLTIEESRSALSGSGELARSVLFNNALDTFKSLSTNAITCRSTSRPPSPVVGQMIFESDTQQVYFWNGTAWMTPGSPSGSLQAFAGAAAPTGWLLCDGSLYTVDLYPTLYAVLGVTYGGTLGVSFNVPNMAGRILVGAGTGGKQGATGSGVISGGTALTTRIRGQFFGDERTESHTHTQNSHNHLQDSHNHLQNSHNHLQDAHSHYTFDRNTIFSGVAGGTDAPGLIEAGSRMAVISSTATNQAQTATNQAQTATNQAQTAINQSTFAGIGENTQPSVVANYIIKT